MTHTYLVRAMAVAALLWSIGAPQAQAQGTMPKAFVEAVLLSTGRSGTPVSGTAATGKDLGVGDEWVTGVSADFRGSRSAGGWPTTDTASYAWRVQVRVLAIRVESVHVEITWGRYSPGRARSAAPDISDTRIVDLMDEDRYVLDLVQSDEPDSPIASNVIEVRAGVMSDPAFQHTAVEYDLWFVHEGTSGAKTARKVALSGMQGGWQAFSFQPMGFRLDGKPVPAGVPAPLAVVAEGEVLARLRSDGTVGLAVRSYFGISCSTPGGGGRNGGEGVKELVAVDGESIAIELPMSSGWCTVTPAPTIPRDVRPGVGAFSGGVRVVGTDFFRDERFSLVITARRVR